MVVYIQNFKQAGSVYFAINSKSSAGNILEFELYPPLSTQRWVLVAT